MKKFVAYLLGALVGAIVFGAFVAVDVAPAQEKNLRCMAAAEFIKLVEDNKHEHVVLKGDAMALWITAHAQTGEEMTNAAPDYVIVVFLPDRNAAFVAFGKGEQVCDPMMMPLPLARSMIRPA